MEWLSHYNKLPLGSLRKFASTIAGNEPVDIYTDEGGNYFIFDEGSCTLCEESSLIVPVYPASVEKGIKVRVCSMCHKNLTEVVKRTNFKI